MFTPAWVLMPYRVVFDTHKSLSEGFMNKDDALAYQEKHSDKKSKLLGDEK